MIDRRSMHDGCRPVLERLGAPFGPRPSVGTLSIAEQQLVEIARALHAKSRILVLDEPTTRALLARDRAAVRAGPPAARRRHRADLHQPPHGRDLRAGRPRLGAARRRLCRHPRSATRSAPTSLVKMMVGRDLSTFYKKEHDPHGSRGPVILEVKGLTDGGRRVKPASFQLHQGEVLGHRGPGRLRPDRARAPDLRRRPKAGGEVLLDGKPRESRDAQGRARRRASPT